MSEPPTTGQLSQTAALARRQAADIHDQLHELAHLAALTAVELSPATRRELDAELHTTVAALHTGQLGVCEPRRGHPANS